MPLKVLLVTRAHGTQAGGMERLSFELAKTLAKNPAVTIAVIHHRGPRILAPLFVFLSLPAVLWRARQVQIIHFGDPLLSLSAWIVKKILGKPVCVTVHGLDITYPAGWYQSYLRGFLPVFDAYIAISNHVGRLLEQKQVPNEKITSIAPAVSDTFYDSQISRAQLAGILQRPINNSVVLFTAGRLIQRKGHAWFVENVLPSLPPHVVYVIAGNGPQRNEIMHAAQQAGVANRVVLLNRVSPADLKILYNTVAAFVQPNITVPNDPEGFGLVLLEAALCERPVFAANLDGIPDAVHHQKNGTLLPSGNAAAWQRALQEFCAHPDSQPAAREYTRKTFSWQHTADKYITVFQSCISTIDSTEAKDTSHSFPGAYR